VVIQVRNIKVTHKNQNQSALLEMNKLELLHQFDLTSCPSILGIIIHLQGGNISTSSTTTHHDSSSDRLEHHTMRKATKNTQVVQKVLVQATIHKIPYFIKYLQKNGPTCIPTSDYMPENSY
jgi:hypothetical protein